MKGSVSAEDQVLFPLRSVIPALSSLTAEPALPLLPLVADTVNFILNLKTTADILSYSCENILGQLKEITNVI